MVGELIPGHRLQKANSNGKQWILQRLLEVMAVQIKGGGEKVGYDDISSPSEVDWWAN